MFLPVLVVEDASSQYKELPQADPVVLHLAEPYLDQGWHVFTDKYLLTSIPLTEAFHDRATSFTGTMNKTMNKIGSTYPMNSADTCTATTALQVRPKCVYDAEAY